MENTADDILRAFPAGETAGDMLAEAARLHEMGLGYPLNMMCSLYYESAGGPSSLEGEAGEKKGQTKTSYE